MTAFRPRHLSFAIACTLSISSTAQGQASPRPVDPPDDAKPYEIPLAVIRFSAPTIDPNPVNPYWVPVTPPNPFPNKKYVFYRLFIGTSVNGGKPVPLVFDTGSTAFNIDAGKDYKNVPWLPLKGGAPKLGDPLFYGDGTYGNQTASINASTVEFYKFDDQLEGMQQVVQFSPKQGIPVSLGVKRVATAQSLGPSDKPGDIAFYIIPKIRSSIIHGTFTKEDYDFLKDPTFISDLKDMGYSPNSLADISDSIKVAVPLYSNLTWQESIDAGHPNGIFGAGPFDESSILGQMTKSGYVVAANAQIGDPQNCGSCAHVIMNLNPAIRAQFQTVVPWDGGSSGTFPNSGAPVRKNQFGELFTFTLGQGGPSVTLPTLLDSGTPQLGTISDDGVLSGETTAGHVDPIAHPLPSGNGNAQGNVVSKVILTMTGKAPGAQSTSFVTQDPFFGNSAKMLEVAHTGTFGADSTMLAGIQFFFANSVMYDLQNKSTGYTPFFVPVRPISTTGGYAVTGAMPAQGIAGMVSGSGPLTITQGGAAQLSNANTYTGATRIARGGWLGLAGPGSIATSSEVRADGEFDISRSTGPAFIQSLSGAGTVNLGSTTLELTRAHGTFDGVISDGGLGGGGGGGLILARGSETLTGKNTFTGAVGIAPAGTLDLRGSVSGAVLDAGMLTGNGHVGRDLAVTGAVMPATGIATYQALTVGGNFHQQAQGTYQAQIHPSGASSQLLVHGRAALDRGARLNVLAPAPMPGGLYTKDTSYLLLRADQGLTGRYTFSKVPLSAVLVLTTHYDARRAYLDVVQTRPLMAAGVTRNQIATLSSAQSLRATNPVFTSLANLPTDTSIQHTADALSGEVYASASTALLDHSRLLRDTVTLRLRQARAGSRASGEHLVTQVQPHGWVAWGAFLGAWDHFDADGNAARINDSLNGALAGIDRGVGDHGRLGFVVGSTHTSLSSARTTRSISNDKTLGVYGASSFGKWQLQGGMAYTAQTLTADRRVSLLGGNEALAGRSKARLGQGFAEVGYPLALGSTTLEPFGQIAYLRLQDRGFREVGGDAALTGGSAQHSSTLAMLGTHAETQWFHQGDLVTAHGTLGWRHAAGYIDPVRTLRFAGSTDFTVAGVPLASDAWVIEAGIDVRVRKRLSIGVSYQGQIAAHARTNDVRGSLTWRF